MDTNALTGQQQRLARLPYIASLPFNDKRDALKLIMRGIDETLLHFWYNVRTGNYAKLNTNNVLDTDTRRMMATYPQFEWDIKAWVIGL